jgi:uncharacterized membrane protein
VTSDDSIYRPPESSLDIPISREANFGSVERALNGDFDFEIGDVLSQAWDLTKGSKGVLIGGVAISYGISLVASLLSVAISGGETSDTGAGIAGLAIQIFGATLGYPIMAGMFLYVIKRAAADPSASFGDLFGSFGRFLPILGLMLLEFVLIVVGLLLFVLPGIYLAVAYSFALPLLVEKRMGIWQAMEASRKALGHCWFRFVGLMVVCSLLLGIGGFFTLGVGFIWFIPLTVLSFGVLYRNIFGYEGART